MRRLRFNLAKARIGAAEALLRDVVKMLDRGARGLTRERQLLVDEQLQEKARYEKETSERQRQIYDLIDEAYDVRRLASRTAELID